MGPGPREAIPEYLRMYFIAVGEWFTEHPKKWNGLVISPFIVGSISTNIGRHAEGVGNLEEDHPWLAFLKIQQAMMLIPVILLLASISFFIASKYFESDLEISKKSYAASKFREGFVSQTEKENDNLEMDAIVEFTSSNQRNSSRQTFWKGRKQAEWSLQFCSKMNEK